MGGERWKRLRIRAGTLVAEPARWKRVGGEGLHGGVLQWSWAKWTRPGSPQEVEAESSVPGAAAGVPRPRPSVWSAVDSPRVGLKVPGRGGTGRCRDLIWIARRLGLSSVSEALRAPNNLVTRSVGSRRVGPDAFSGIGHSTGPAGAEEPNPAKEGERSHSEKRGGPSQGMAAVWGDSFHGMDPDRQP